MRKFSLPLFLLLLLPHIIPQNDPHVSVPSKMVVMVNNNTGWNFVSGRAQITARRMWRSRVERGQAIEQISVMHSNIGSQIAQVGLVVFLDVGQYLCVLLAVGNVLGTTTS